MTNAPRIFHGMWKAQGDPVAVAGVIRQPQKLEDDFYFCEISFTPAVIAPRKIYGVSAENALECIDIFINKLLTDIQFGISIVATRRFYL